MKTIKINYCPTSSGVSLQEIKALQERLQPEIERMSQACGRGYESDYASINVPDDKQMIARVAQVIEKKQKELNPTVLVVIGIGGSSLGTVAVHNALNGVLYNQSLKKIKIYFVDTVDSDYTSSVIELVRRELGQGGSVLINVVTKSGTTTETIVNFELFLQLLQKQYPENYAQHIVITTDRDSKLWQYAQQEKIEVLEVPKKVGGRYSVFSAVGLFPLGFVGVDLESLCEGARSMAVDCLAADIMKNPAALSASVVYAQLKKGSIIHDTFIFSRDMRAVGDWYRQLVAESLGKKFDRDGAVVNTGITPTTSVGTNDLHSVAQLHLGGPRDKFTTFVTVNKSGKDLQIPDFAQFDVLVPNIQGKSVFMIVDAVARGVRHAYQSDERPFVSIEFPAKTEFYLGQFLQMKMMEVIYLGYLMNVNPFDQPNVEAYKKETKKILANE